MITAEEARALLAVAERVFPISRTGTRRALEAVVTLTEQLAEVAEHRDQLGAQIETLAEFIIAEIPGEPSQSQGAVHTAIRLLATYAKQLAAAEAREERVRALHVADRNGWCDGCELGYPCPTVRALADPEPTGREEPA